LQYALAGTLTYWLTNEHKDLNKSKQTYTDNQLETSVKTMTTFSLIQAGANDKIVNHYKAKVLTGLRATGVWHYALLTEALEASVTEIK
jgi:hypothetical protein